MGIALEDFLISEERVASLENREWLVQQFTEGKSLQALFGFSNEVMSHFYEVACRLLGEKRYEEASDAFVFLTTLNPYLGEFWIGLGIAEQEKGKFDEALFALSVAFQLDERTIFPYILACQCCLDQGNPERALQILDEAEARLDRLPEEEVNLKFRHDLKETREYVEARQRGGK